MKVWVTRRQHNRYMLTHARPGDPLVVQDLCPWGVTTLWPDLNLQPLQSERRTLRGE